MDQGPERACLAIADVSGYTSYIAGVELDHAQDILSDLTVTVVEALAPFQLAKLEGDAAFMFLPGQTLDGSTLQDTVESTYAAFRRRLRDIKQASTCECDACILIPALDLKIVVHEGPIGRQSLMGLEELVGQEVILVHRLLKNGVREDTGIDAYALYTQAAVDAARFDPAAQGLSEHREDTDVAGSVTCWLRDLHEVWADIESRPMRSIPVEQRFRTWEMDVDAPRQLVFEHLTEPTLRLGWDQSIDRIEEDSVGNAGRRGAGTTNHCVHGSDAILERILDWHPPDSWLTETTVPMPGSPRFLKTEEFTTRPDGGTHVKVTIGSVAGRTPADDAQVFEFVGGNLEVGIERVFRQVHAAVAELAKRSDSLPHLPERGDRHLTEPVGGG